MDSSDINFNSIKILDVHQEGNIAFIYSNFNNKQGEKFFGYIPLIRQKNSTVWINRNNGLILEKSEDAFKNGEINEGETSTYREGRKFAERFREGVRISNGTKVYSDSAQYSDKWQNDKSPEETQKLLNQGPQHTARLMEVSSQDLGTSSRKLYQSDVPPEQVALQTSGVEEIAVKKGSNING